MNNIDDAVIYISDQPDSEEPTPPPAHEEDGAEDDHEEEPTAPPAHGEEGAEEPTAPSPPEENGSEDERQLLMELDKEELVSYNLQLQKEVSRSKNIIQSLRLQRDWIIDKKAHLVELLELIDVLTDARKAEVRSSTHSIATTATPLSIDRTWENVCDKSEHWRLWWQSGKPKPLKRTSVASTSTSTPPGNTSAPPGNTNTPPGNLSTPPGNANTHPRNTRTPPRNSTATHPGNIDTDTLPDNTNTPSANTNAAATSSNPSTQTNNRNNNNKREKKRTKRGNQQQQTPHHAAAQPPAVPHLTHPRGSRSQGSRGGWEDKSCQYCFRHGHAAEACYSRAADLRQEMVLRRVLTETWGREQPSQPQLPFQDLRQTYQDPGQHPSSRHHPETWGTKPPSHPQPLLQDPRQPPSWQPHPTQHHSWSSPSWQGRH